MHCYLLCCRVLQAVTNSMWTSSFVTFRRRRKPPNYYLRGATYDLIDSPSVTRLLNNNMTEHCNNIIAIFWNNVKSTNNICRDECRCPKKTIILIYVSDFDRFVRTYILKEYLISSCDWLNRDLFVTDVNWWTKTEINLFLRIYPKSLLGEMVFFCIRNPIPDLIFRQRTKESKNQWMTAGHELTNLNR